MLLFVKVDGFQGVQVMLGINWVVGRVLRGGHLCFCDGYLGFSGCFWEGEFNSPVRGVSLLIFGGMVVGERREYFGKFREW
jgi:hypothetical protein